MKMPVVRCMTVDTPCVNRIDTFRIGIRARRSIRDFQVKKLESKIICCCAHRRQQQGSMHANISYHDAALALCLGCILSEPRGLC